MSTQTPTVLPPPVPDPDEHGDQIDQGRGRGDGDHDRQGVGLSPRALFGRVNRFLYSKHTGLSLILAMAFLALMGTLLQQAPESVRDDPASYAQWLDSVRPRYRGWTGPLSAAGMFHVFSSLWFVAVTVLLALSIVACTAHRIPQLWQRAMHPHLHVTPGFFDHARLRGNVTLPGDPDASLAQVSAALRRHGYRTCSDPKGAGHSLYADRMRFAPFGTVFAHAGFVVILLGVLVSGTTGFEEEQFPVTVGSRVDVGHDTALSVQAASFSDAYYDDGRPKDYASDLILFENGTQVDRRTVRVNAPLRHEGVTFYQSYFGVSADVKVSDPAGAVVFRGGVPLQWTSTDDRHSIGKLPLPDRGLLVYVLTAASGRADADLAPGQLQVDVYRQGEEAPFASQVVEQGRAADVAGLTYTFERERQFTGLIVRKDPGALWVWIGCGLMTAGLIVTMSIRHRRIWVRVHPEPDGLTRVRIAASERHDVTFESWFARFVSQLDAPQAARRPVGR